MKRLLIIILFLLPVLLLAGSRKYIIIKKGDTLWSISKKYNVPLDTLCQINKIKDKTAIKTGMRLYLTAKPVKKKTTIKKLSLKLAKPINGQILNKYNEGNNVIQCNGIEFQSSRNSHVKCSYKGTVKYTGSLRGYGKVIIIEHTPKVSTIYAYLSRIMVSKGTQVNKNQAIGIVGENNITTDNVLHFELLYNGKPINPIWYIQ